MKQPLNVLIIEDYANEAALAVRQLEKEDYQVTFRRIESASEFSEALKSSGWDLILSDYYLPQFSAPDAICMLKKSGLNIPFIVLSGKIGEETAVSMMKSGAQDYLMKDNLSRLGYVVRRAITEIHHEKERKKAEEALRQSEERHRMLFELESDALFLFDRETGSILEANPAASILYGYEHDELLTMKFSEITTESDREFYPAHEGIASLPMRVHRKKDGTIFPTEITARQFLWKNKEVLLVAVRDITTRVNAENRLRESEAYFRTLVDTSPDAIIFSNLEFRIVYGSRKAYEMFRIPPHDPGKVVGSPITKWMDKNQAKLATERLTTLAKGNTLSSTQEYLLLRFDGTKFWGEISSSVIRNERGEMNGILTLIRDVTQKKTQEQQMIHTARLAGLGEIATGIAHEINQPLNTITLGIENIIDEISENKKIDPDYLRNKAEKFHNNILKIRNIIDHIRAFSRDQANFLNTSFDIHESIRNAISMISEQFEYRGIEIINSFDKRIGPAIGNTYRFEQVILNLLVNSKDALEDKTKMIRSDFRKLIRIKTILENDKIRIYVVDNGAGIRDDDKDKVLLPFFSTKQEGQGTGLGLSISYGIIKEMGGTLEIKSKYNIGTTVIISLPANGQGRSQKSNRNKKKNG